MYFERDIDRELASNIDKFIKKGPENGVNISVVKGPVDEHVSFYGIMALGFVNKIKPEIIFTISPADDASTQKIKPDQICKEVLDIPSIKKEASSEVSLFSGHNKPFVAVAVGETVESGSRSAVIFYKKGIPLQLALDIAKGAAFAHQIKFN